MQVLCSPNSQDVESYIKNNIKLDKRILHLVPTLILFNRRKSLYWNLLKNWGEKLPSLKELGNDDREVSKKLVENNIYLFEVDRFMEYLVRESRLKVLTKRESSIILERVMKKNPNTSNYAWLSTLSDINDLFVLLSSTGLTKNEIGNFSANKSWESLMDLYVSYLNELDSLNMLDFGLATKKIIEDSKKKFEQFDEVYIDGAFLPIKPILHKIITTLEEREKDISFFIPFDFDNPDSLAFQVLKTTYTPYVPFEKWQSINTEKQDFNVVEKLARNIFSDRKVAIDDPSVKVLVYDTSEEELGDIVFKAVNYINKARVNPAKIAIITPNIAETKPIVREFIELYNVKADTPERPLVQLPYGKFIYILYQIFNDEKIQVFGISDNYLDIDMVSDLIQLNVINESSTLIPIYEKIKVFFEDCTSFEEWKVQIDLLITSKEHLHLNEKYKYHPLYYVTEESLYQFKDFLFYLEYLSKKIVTTEPKPFDQHLEYLIKTIESEEKILPMDDDTKKRILNVQKSISQAQNIDIDVNEFSSRIQSVFIDNNRNDNVEEDSKKITVTGPFNIEFQDYDYVFLTQFTQSKYPEAISYSWPINMDIEYKILKETTKLGGRNSNYLKKYYLDRSLYYLYLVINSTRRNLTISYSKKQDGIEQTVSHYLHDIASVFNLYEDLDSKNTLEDVLENVGLLMYASSGSQDGLIYDIKSEEIFIPGEEIISIEDIATYEYCPKRFYYKKRYPEHNVYANSFQLQHYVTACLYEECVHILVERFSEVKKSDVAKIMSKIDGIIQEAKNKLETIFPMSLRHWEDIILRTKFHIEQLFKSIFRYYNKATLSLDNGQRVTKTIDNFTFIGERQLRVKYNNSVHYYTISNLKEILAFAAKDIDHEDRIRLNRIKVDYRNLLRDFCREKEDVEYKLRNYTLQFKSNKFKKIPGGHCQYCTFNQFCLEKEIVNNESNIN